MNQIPEDILLNDSLSQAIQSLSSNYDFEIHKTLWRIKRDKCKRAALQFPDGLLIFAAPIASIIESFSDAECVIIGDVTYGACCIEDTTAFLLGCDLIIHYGHSCLIPIDQLPSGMGVMYVFVRIRIESNRVIEAILNNLKYKERNLVLCGTVQFISCLQNIKEALMKDNSFGSITIPQSKPLSAGELLGCTAPTLSGSKTIDSVDGRSHSADVVECDEDRCIVYLGDGRFHLEAMMIANPLMRAYQYNPYTSKLTIERYDHDSMRCNRNAQIVEASKSSRFAVIKSTLGRQGSPKVTKKICQRLDQTNVEYILCVMSELDNTILRQIYPVQCWIQIACPRLSIDWGCMFDKPLLNPYEAMVCFKKADWKIPYPMDFYAFESSGFWTPNNASNREKRSKRTLQLVKNRRPMHLINTDVSGIISLKED